MVKRRGRCPSFISGTHGAPRLDVAKGKRTCQKCKTTICKGSTCVIVPKPGSMGRKVYCQACTLEIIDKSRQDLSEFESSLTVQRVATTVT